MYLLRAYSRNRNLYYLVRMKKNSTNNVSEIPISKLSDQYASFRFINRSSEKDAVESIGRFGLLTPIVVSPGKGKRYEIIDGFKRYRACKKMKIKTIKATILDVSPRSIKAAIIFLNRNSGSITDLEETLVVRSLYRDENLKQAEIGVLLNRHKSWVSRRISLIERLDENVVDHIKLGLVSISIGRELFRLPRGNQEEVMKTVIKLDMTSSETKRFIDNLLKFKGIDNDLIFKLSEEILDNRSQQSQSQKRTRKKSELLEKKLIKIERDCSLLFKFLSQNDFRQIPKREQKSICFCFDKMKHSFNLLDDIFQNFSKETIK